MLNESIDYRNAVLTCDGVLLTDIARDCGTPVYVYSRSRIEANYRHIRQVFSSLDAHIHYSVKANGNLAVLQTLLSMGAGMDVVSGGEIHRALLAGTDPADIVFAGVGKTHEELAYAVEQGVGWINVENSGEIAAIETLAAQYGYDKVNVALRLNPGVTANTHPYIATGHGGAKFGLTAVAIADLLKRQSDFPHVAFKGIHVHIGSQLHDTDATTAAVQVALDLIKPYPQIRTVNIGGGLPVAYTEDDPVPDIEAFATVLAPLLKGYSVILEPGRSIVADAGLLLAEVLYIKQQAGQTFAIIDASMNELMRPALYQAEHHIVPVLQDDPTVYTPVQIVGPVCETADVLGRNISMPALKAGDLVAILTSGAYGVVMAGNYNARPRPAEVMVEDDASWRIVAHREQWSDLVARETVN